MLQARRCLCLEVAIGSPLPMNKYQTVETFKHDAFSKPSLYNLKHGHAKSTHHLYTPLDSGKVPAQGKNPTYNLSNLGRRVTLCAKTL